MRRSVQIFDNIKDKPNKLFIRRNKKIKKKRLDTFQQKKEKKEKKKD